VDDVDYTAADEALERKADEPATEDYGPGTTEDYGPGLNQVNTEQDEGTHALVSASSRYAVTDNDLPEGWTAVYDPLSSSTYYWNQNTKETTWDRPTE